MKPRGDVPADQGGGEYGLGIWHTGLIRCGEAWGNSGRLSSLGTDQGV